MFFLFIYCSLISLIKHTLISRFMGPTWDVSAPGEPHVGLMNLAIWVYLLRVFQDTSLAPGHSSMEAY